MIMKYTQKIDQNLEKIDIEIKKLLQKRVCYFLEGKGYHIEKTEFPEKSIKFIFSEIDKVCENILQPKKIAYLGPEATFTHMAAKTKFGESAKYLSAKSIGEVFSHVEIGRANYGVVPIENTSEGMVNYTLDRILDTNLSIIGEMIIRVSHYLLSKEKDTKNIKKIYSHPQAFAQCRYWIERKMPDIESIETKSTGKAAFLVQKEKNTGAIGTKLASTIYGLNILAEHIEDSAQNYTRFLIIGKEKPKPTGNDKTSIALAIKDRIGALFNLMKPFAENRVNMNKIESRPSKQKPWDYVFFIDMDGHIENENVKKTLGNLEDLTKFLKILGSYPKANSID